MDGSAERLPSSLTLGWLEQKYLSVGSTGVSEAIKALSPKHLLADHAILHRDDGIPSVRLDIQKADAIRYVNFSPPALWGAPITVLRMQLESVEKRDVFVFHSGEEIVVPIRGTIRYRFLWSKGGEPLHPHEEDFIPGELGAIHPPNPHHGWAVNGDSAEAWLVLYHDPDSSAAFDIAANIQNTKVQHDRRRLASSDLQAPGEYALIAWDIADRIKTQRQRVNLTINQMASLINLDPSHLSRLENACTNLSLEVLIKICEFLRIDLRSLLTSPRWCCERRTLKHLASDVCGWKDKEHKHVIHPRYHSIRKGKQMTMNSCVHSEPKLSTWIVLSGQLRIEFPAENPGKSALLDEGEVFHFRERCELRIAALSDCEIVSFHLSSLCPASLTSIC